MPRPTLEDDEGPDPRIDLVARLQEYERFKQAAETLRAQPQMDKELFAAQADLMQDIHKRQHPDIAFNNITQALKGYVPSCENVFASLH